MTPGATPLSGTARRRVLVVFDNPVPQERTRVTILQHLRSIELAPGRPEVDYFNVSEEIPDWRSPECVGGDAPDQLRKHVYDAVILHYTFLGLRVLGREALKLKKVLAWLPGLGRRLVAIPQDEPDFGDVLDEWLFEWGVEIVFSVQYQEGGKLYPRTSRYARMIPCLPGYFDEDASGKLTGAVVPLAERTLDVAYRVRKLPLWYGSAGAQKYELAVRAQEAARKLGLRADIATGADATVVGRGWLEFLARSRVVLGAEGGFSTFDHRGETKAIIARWVDANPKGNLQDLRMFMGPGWDSERFYTITPRHFDAIVARSAQVLIRGHYRGVLRADEHYLPISPDLSDLEDVLRLTRDVGRIQALADRCHEEIYGSGRFTYRAFARVLEEEIFTLPAGYDADNVEAPVDRGVQAHARVLEREILALRHELALRDAERPEISQGMVTPLEVARQLARAKRQLVAALAVFSTAILLGVFLLFKFLR